MNKKTFALVSICLFSTGMIVSGLGFSLASFVREKTIPDQSASSDLTITAAGRRKKAYFLDLNNVWSTADSATFWAIAWNSSYVGDWTSATGMKNFAWTKGVLSGNNYEFFVDRVKYDKIEFVRYNGGLSNPTAFANKEYNASGVYNYTSNLDLPAESSNSFTYRITSYHSGDNNSPSTGTWY